MKDRPVPAQHRKRVRAIAGQFSTSAWPRHCRLSLRSQHARKSSPADGSHCRTPDPNCCLVANKGAVSGKTPPVCRMIMEAPSAPKRPFGGAMHIFDEIRVQNLERRQFHLTMLASMTIAVLAAGVAILMYPTIFSQDLLVSRLTFQFAFYGFCCLSVLLVGYLWDRQITI